MRLLKILILSALFFFAVAVFFSQVQSPSSFFFFVPLSALLVGLVLSLFHDRVANFALGTALCTLPVFGAGVLNLFVLGWVTGFFFLRALLGYTYSKADLSGAKEISTWAFLLVLLPVLCAAGLTVAADFDGWIVGSTVLRGGITSLYDYLSASSVSWHRALAISSGAFLAGALFFSILAAQSIQDSLRALCAGLLFGSLLSILFLIGQISQLSELFLLNLGSFWRFEGRYNGMFSDPNAFGVMAFLLIPMFFLRGLSQLRYSLGAIALLGFSVWSGSRSLYLGLMLWGALYALSMVLLSGRKELRIALGGAVLLLGIFFAILGSPSVNSQLQEALPYPGTVRLLKTLSWDSSEGMFFSRRVYTQIALGAWSESPLTGLGLERFYDRQLDVMIRLGIDLAGWRDNANNYYLQVLAEQGALGLLLSLIGFLLFGVVLLSKEKKTLIDSDRSEGIETKRLIFAGRTLVFVLAFVLLTGPHILFDEVRYLSVILLAAAVSRPIAISAATLRSVRMGALSLSLIYPAIFMFSVAEGIDRTRSIGVYHREQSSAGPIVWTTDKALLTLCDKEGATPPAEVTLSYRALHPDLSKRPLRVAFYPTSERRRDLLPVKESVEKRKLSTTDWHEVTIPRYGVSAGDRFAVGIRVERVWSPRLSGSGVDPRFLGIQIRLPEGTC